MSLHLNLKLRTISNGFAGLSLAMVMSACASNPKDVMAPELTFKASASECANTVDFSNPIALEDKEKTRKKAMRARRVVLTSFMGDEDTDCIVGASGEVLPYASFELPTGMKGRVVSAGAVLDQKVIFAADVTTYDINGQKVRHFDRDEFRRFGGIYGVQFKPKTNETYVVIQADPALVGETNNTVETRRLLRLSTLRLVRVQVRTLLADKHHLIVAMRIMVMLLFELFFPNKKNNVACSGSRGLNLVYFQIFW